MKKFNLLITVGLIAIMCSCRQDDTLTITGKLNNLKDSIITISYGRDIVTGIAPSGYQKEYIINKDGTFSIPIIANPPVSVSLYSQNYRFNTRVNLLSSGKLDLSVDCNTYPASIEFYGTNSNLNTFLLDWLKFYREAHKNNSDIKDSFTRYEYCLDSLETVSLEMLDSIDSNKILSEDEFLWLKTQISYVKFNYLLMRAVNLKVQPNDSAYLFLQTFNLNDNDACLISESYNSVLTRYILHNLNLRDIYHSNYNDNSYFFQMYYETINRTLKGKVKDVMLTRFISDLFNMHNGQTNELYKQYLIDCESPDMIEKTTGMHQEYLKIVNKNLSDEVIIIPTDEQSPMKILNQFKNKVIYLNFWASWCSPCIRGLPHIIKLSENYIDQELVVLHIGHKDQRSNLINAIKKHNLEGFHIILNENESEIWREEFDISQIPTYVLIDKDGKVINKNAPNPYDEKIYDLIDSLLEIQ